MRKLIISGAFALAAALAASSAGAAVLLSDNFDTENGGAGVLNYSGFANFNVSNAGSGGAVDLIGNGFFDFYPGNGLYIDICGSRSACGVLTTNQIFAPGTYTVTLDLAGNARSGTSDGTTVNFGAYSNTVMLSTSQLDTLTFTTTLGSASALSIGDLGLLGPDVGNILLSVEVQNANNVPEPISLSLFGAGLAGLGMVRRRKRNA